MGKFSGPSVIPGAQVELPTQAPTGGDFAEFFQQAPQEAPTPPANIPTPEQPAETQGIPEGQEPYVQQLEEAALIQEQQERERVPAFAEKVGGALTSFETQQDDPLGAALERGNNVVNVLDYQAEGPSLIAQPTAEKRELVKQGFPEAGFASEGGVKALKGSEASITAAQTLIDPRVLDAGYVRDDGTIGIQPEFGKVMSLATENWLLQQSLAVGAETKQESADFLPEGVEEAPASDTFTKATGNDALGKEIYRQWKRQKAANEGRPTDEYVAEEANISPETFTFIGDMAKEVYAEANPKMLERFDPTDSNPQVTFQVTADGVAKLNHLDNTFKGLLGTPEVPPLNAVSDTAQPVFEAATRVRKRTTVVGELKDTSQVDEAMKNYHSVAYVNDPQRESLGYLFAIQGLLNHSTNNVYANMFDLGASRVQAVEGNKTKLLDEAARETDPEKARKKSLDAQNYNVKNILDRDRGKFLNILGGTANYSGKANHLTFSMQGLTGRTHIQQTVYNPQAHKFVRFVTGSGNVYKWKPGEGVIDRNFREIMAATFLQDVNGKAAKDLTTEVRLKEFERQFNSGQMDNLIEMGRELGLAATAFDVAGAKEIAQRVTNAKSPQEANEIKREVAQRFGNDPLSDNTKAELAKHGDEGPHFANALVELAKYADAKKNGRPMHSTITVEMDGKTHGPATNGAQLGIKSMAERTGLIRSQDYTLTDDIDSRKAMGEYMVNITPSMSGTMYPQDQAQVYNDLVGLAVQDRANFLKKSPMTMGYGQELGSLRMHVDTTIFNGPQSGTIQKLIKDHNISPKQAGDFLHAMLVDSIYNVFDRKVVDSGRLLRANNLLATLTNEVLYMDNAMGFRSYAAAKQNQPEAAEQAQYRFTGKDKDTKGRKVTTQFYKSKAEGSALRSFEEGQAPVPGGFGHGRVIPIAVQSYDGNMVSKTGSGQSWDRVKSTAKARGGRPFVLPVFDAFVTDLGSFDTVRDEANKNWVDGLKDHSYITSIMDTWFKETRGKFSEKFKNLDLDQVVPVNQDTEWRGIHWAFNTFNDSGQPALQGLLKKVIHVEPKRPGETIGDYQQGIGRQAGKVMKEIYQEMDRRGIPHEFDSLSNRQIYDLINIVMKKVNISNRNSSMVSQISRDKAKLFEEVARNRREARQVDIA